MNSLLCEFYVNCLDRPAIFGNICKYFTHFQIFANIVQISKYLQIFYTSNICNIQLLESLSGRHEKAHASYILSSRCMFVVRCDHHHNQRPDRNHDDHQDVYMSDASVYDA